MVEPLSPGEEARRDYALLETLRPDEDPKTGLAMRRPGPEAKRYQEVLDSILEKWGGLEEFERAFRGTEDPNALKVTITPEPAAAVGQQPGAGAPLQGPPAPEPATMELQDFLPLSAPVAGETKEGLRDRLIQEIMATLPDMDPDAPVPGQITDPPFTDEIADSTARVLNKFQQGFGEEFTDTAQAPVVGSESIPGLGPDAPIIDPIMRGLSDLGGKLVQGGENVLKGMAGIGTGSFAAGTQLLQELGLDKGEGQKAMRDLFAGIDVAVWMSIPHPGKFSQAFRKVTGLEKARRIRIERRQKRLAIVAARKINLARRKMREEAKKLDLPEALNEEMEQRLAVVTNAIREKMEQSADLGRGVVIRSPEEILDYAPTLTQEALTPAIQKQAIEVAQRVLQETQNLKGIPPNALTRQRVQDTVYDLLTSDDKFTIALQAEVNASGMAWETFLDAFLVTGTEAARSLGLRSRFYDRLHKASLLGDKTATEVLKVLKEGGAKLGRTRLTAMEKIQPLWQRGGRLFRMLVLTLPSTAIRNLGDATLGRVSIGTMNRVIDESLRKMYPAGRDMAGPVDPMGELGRVFGWIRAPLEKVWLPESLRLHKAEGILKERSFELKIRDPIHRRLGKKKVVTPKMMVNKEEVERILNAYPKTRDQLRRVLEQDVPALKVRQGNATTMDHVENVVNRVGLAMNRAQEMFVRDIVFGAKLDQELRRVGSSVHEVLKYGDRPVGMDWALREAVHHALDITFALDPAKIGGPVAKMFNNFGKLINAIPGGPIFIETFPAFLFNLTKFILEHTPTGGLRLIRPVNIAKIAEGDMSVAAKEISATVILTAALAIRQGMIPGVVPGARYDELLNDKGERISFQPYASLAPWLFIADFLIRVQEGRILGNADDLRELRRGLTASSPQTSKLTSVGEDLIESLFNIDSTTDYQDFLDVTGEKMGAALRPLELHRIWMEETNEAWRLMREKRGQGFWASTLDMLKGPDLPERESATRKETNVRTRVDLPFGLGNVSSGLAAQFTGLLRRESRNPIERELVKMGFGSRDLNPKMHNARLNALVLRFQGEFLEVAGNELIKLVEYRRLGVKAKQNELRILLSGGKSRVLGRIEGVRAKAIRLARKAAPYAFGLKEFKTLPGTEKEAWIKDYNRIMERTGILLPAEEFLHWLEWETDQELKREGL